MTPGGHFGIELNFCFFFSLQLHAFQIAHDPNVRQTVREAFVERARITVRPTKNGLRDIGKSKKPHLVKTQCESRVTFKRQSIY